MQTERQREIVTDCEDTETDRQRETRAQTDRQTDRQTDKQTNRQADIDTDTQAIKNKILNIVLFSWERLKNAWSLCTGHSAGVGVEAMEQVLVYR